MSRPPPRRQDLRLSDLRELPRNTLELLGIVVPATLLFYLCWLLWHEALFFIPEWRWRAVHEGGPGGRFFVDWTARRALSLALAIPSAFLAYSKTFGAWRQWRRQRVSPPPADL